MSANQIAVTIGNCAFMIVMSIGAATTIRVSHCYGARNIGELSLAAKASYHLVLAWNAFAALVFITMRNVIPTFFTTNAEVIAIASQLMVFAALYQLSDGIQNVSVGILRGIQDVKIIMPIAFVSLLAAQPARGLPVRLHARHGSVGTFPRFLVRSVGRRRDDDPPHTTQHTTLVPQRQLKIKKFRIFAYLYANYTLHGYRKTTYESIQTRSRPRLLLLQLRFGVRSQTLRRMFQTPRDRMARRVPRKTFRPTSSKCVSRTPAARSTRMSTTCRSSGATSWRSKLRPATTSASSRSRAIWWRARCAARDSTPSTANSRRYTAKPSPTTSRSGRKPSNWSTKR